MESIFSPKILDFAKKLDRPLYAVVGIVRNYLIDKSKSSDFDLASDISSDELVFNAEKSGLKVLAVYNRTGTVNFTDGENKYEYTAFRKEKYVGGEHTPYEVQPTSDIAEDARRRDFKCNAVYFDLKNLKFVDPLLGIKDIENKVLDTVVSPELVFKHDGLRLMRLARFSAELNFTPTEQVVLSAKNCAENINQISAERIFSELNRILVSDGKYSFSGSDAHYRGLKVLDNIRVLDRIVPELTLGRGMVQRADFHDHDVLEHSFRCVKYSDRSIRLASLLHDVGKPYCMINEGKYHNHYIEGKKIAVDVLKRLRADNQTIEEVAFLTYAHMLDMDCKMRESKIRLFIAKNYSLIDKLLKLKQADYMACKDDFGECKTVAKWRDVLDKMQNDGTPITLRELKINASDLKMLGYSGKQIGKELEKLKNECVVEPYSNQREKLLKKAERDLNKI